MSDFRVMIKVIMSQGSGGFGPRMNPKGVKINVFSGHAAIQSIHSSQL